MNAEIQPMHMTDEEVLAALGFTPDSQRLGEGVEAAVYALDDEKVLRVYKPQGSDTTYDKLVQLQRFYKSLQEGDVSFSAPDTLDVGQSGDRLYSVDRRVHGEVFDDFLGRLDGEQREAALLEYLGAAEQIQKLHPPYDYFGEILASDPVRAESWPDYLREKLKVDYEKAKDTFDREVPDMQRVMSFIDQEADLVSDVKEARLVHGDYYALNVLADEQGISAVMDFNDLALAGDPRMDLASSIIFFFQGAGHTRPEDSKFLYNNLVQKYGKNTPRIIHLYRLYYAIHFASFCEKSDPETFEWSIQSLREHLADEYAY